MIAVDEKRVFLISGNGDVIEPDEGIIGIGSGGPVAQAAGNALLKHTDFDVEKIALEAMKIAGDLCIYTNDSITIEKMETVPEK